MPIRQSVAEVVVQEFAQRSSLAFAPEHLRQIANEGTGHDPFPERKREGLSAGIPRVQEPLQYLGLLSVMLRQLGTQRSLQLLFQE